MAEGRVDDGMIEIGDPNEEPVAPDAPPKVVIEYRERGVPWMLIPPLLVVSALGAVLAYHKWAPQAVRTQVLARSNPPAVAPEPSKPIVPPPSDRPALPAAKEATPPTTPTLPEPTLPAAPVEPPTPPAVPSVVTLPPPIESPPLPETNPIPAPAPAQPVQGFGFDPKALEDARNADAPSDPSLTIAGKEGRADGPAPVEGEKPREVDPDLLPPDRRQLLERERLRVAQAFKDIEVERPRFHSALRAVCQKFQPKTTSDDILNVLRQFETPIEAISADLANKLLGKSGKYAGIDRTGRIDLLRKIGFPEAAILVDLFEHDPMMDRVGARDGPSTKAEAKYLLARFLLKHPPSKPNNPAGAATNARPGRAAGPAPAARVAQ